MYCRKFEDLWSELLPHIASMKPATDLCDTCQPNMTKIMHSANVPDHQKSVDLKKQSVIQCQLNRKEKSTMKNVCQPQRRSMNSPTPSQTTESAKPTFSTQRCQASHQHSPSTKYTKERVRPQVEVCMQIQMFKPLKGQLRSKSIHYFAIVRQILQLSSCHADTMHVQDIYVQGTVLQDYLEI